LPLFALFHLLSCSDDYKHLHSFPTRRSSDLDYDSGGTSMSFGGKYLPITKDDATPGAITWDGQLESVFKEIDFLLSYIFQMSETDRKSTRLNSSHVKISYAVFCLKKKNLTLS